MALADYQSLVDRFVQDTSDILTDADRDDAIELACVRYSSDQPREIIEALSPDGSDQHSLPAYWLRSVSVIKEMMTSSTSISAIETLTVDGFILKFSRAAGLAETLEIHYTGKHIIDATSDTIPSKDREAVACYTAAIMLEQLSTYYAGTRQSSLRADSVNWQNKSSEFSKRAKSLRQRYLDHLGIDPKRVVGSSVHVSTPRTDSRGGRRFFHGGRP